jgi:choline dehydrogenase-like flavoprotein
MKNASGEYDVIVVGSGAGGGIAAHVLTQRGLRVALLEAGRNYDPGSETPMFRIGAEAPLNAAATPDKPLGFYDATIGGLNIPDEPYTVAPGTHFRWFRARMLGGRTNHWGRVTLRYGPYDFQMYRRYGVGADWPIAYEDLAPYYDWVEKLIGVFGAAEGIENSPDSPPGVLLPPPPMHAHELWMQMVLPKRLGIPVVPNHAAILTQPYNGRPACLYATPCMRGCSIGANFQTPTVLLPLALATGRLDIRTDAMVYNVALNERGRVSGVHYIDKSTNARHLLRSRSVVLAASTGETARILLNSRSASFPDGLANSSGQVGRNLTDTVATLVTAQIPALRGLPSFNDDGVSMPHAYVPWWGHREQSSGRLGFATDYHVIIAGGRSLPEVAQFSEVPSDQGKPLFGQKLRDRLRHEFGSRLWLCGNGGMTPNADCFCEIDPVAKDQWGVPVLRFHWKQGAQELEQARHSVASMSDMISALGGTPTVRTWADGGTVCTGGESNHELGTARMGTRASDSVLNSFGQAWDVPNLFVADGSAFVGQAGKNPTHTIMALAWRASDHLADCLVRKDL